MNILLEISCSAKGARTWRAVFFHVFSLFFNVSHVLILESHHFHLTLFVKNPRGLDVLLCHYLHKSTRFLDLYSIYILTYSTTSLHSTKNIQTHSFQSDMYIFFTQSFSTRISPFTTSLLQEQLSHADFFSTEMFINKTPQPKKPSCPCPLYIFFISVWNVVIICYPTATQVSY